MHNLKIKYCHHFHSEIFSFLHIYISHASESVYIPALLPRMLFSFCTKGLPTHILIFVSHAISSVKPTKTTLDNMIPVELPCIEAILSGLESDSVALASHLTSLSYLWNGDAKSSYFIGLLQRLYDLINTCKALQS